MKLEPPPKKTPHSQCLTLGQARPGIVSCAFLRRGAGHVVKVQVQCMHGRLATKQYAMPWHVTQNFFQKFTVQESAN
jgi:hypothetical protein